VARLSVPAIGVGLQLPLDGAWEVGAELAEEAAQAGAARPPDGIRPHGISPPGTQAKSWSG
jgi:hypothetical protein